MGSRRTFRPRCTIVEPRRDPGTKEERSSWNRPSKGVGAIRDLNARGGFGQSESSGVDRREKLLVEVVWRPYRKPTQVGEASSLR